MNTKPLILFDGVCNLCDSTVQFIIRHDKKAKFHFASLQSEFGQKILLKYNLSTTDLDTFILIENEIVYKKSTAALWVLKKLPKFSAFYFLFIWLPSPWRDFFYSLIAKNRYKWWGKKESCMIPSPEIRKRFLS